MRKKLCTLLPESLTFFETAANQHNLPFTTENKENSGGEKMVVIWIEFNHTTFAMEIVVPFYQELKDNHLNSFNKVFTESHA